MKLRQAAQHTRDWLFPHRDLLGGALLLFFGSAFVLSPSTLWTFVYYIGVFPILIFTILQGARPNLRDPGLILACLLVLWSGITLFWGEDPGKGRVCKYAFGAFFTASYILALSIQMRRDPSFLRRIGSVFIVAGGLNAIFSIAAHFCVQEDRLNGWAETRHPIIGALVIGIAYIFALYRLIHEPKRRLGHGAVVLLCIAFVALTQSRGPYAATLVVTMILGSTLPKRSLIRALKLLTLSVLALAVAVFALDPGLPERIVQKLGERGMSYRLDIWSFTLDRIKERPWTGHGPAAYLGMNDNFTFPHNMLLSTLFYNGIVGLVLLLALGLYAFIRLARRWRSDGRAPLIMALLFNGIIGGITDLGQLSPGPAPIWLLLWLPLLCATALKQPSHPLWASQ